MNLGKISNKNNSLGFTIVELLIVVVIIGVLASITIISYTGISQKASVAVIKSDLSSASQQIKVFQALSPSNDYPTANNCPTPGLTEVCLKSSGSNTYSYTYNNSSNPKTFNLETTVSSIVYRVTDSIAPMAIVSTPITAIGAITGTATVGGTLTAGALTPGGATVSYQWQSATTSGGVYSDIVGATNSAYVLTDSEIGEYIKVIAIGNSGYSGSQISTASNIVDKTIALTFDASSELTSNFIQNLSAGDTQTVAGGRVTFAPNAGGPVDQINWVRTNFLNTRRISYLKIIASYWAWNSAAGYHLPAISMDVVNNSGTTVDSLGVYNVYAYNWNTGARDISLTAASGKNSWSLNTTNPNVINQLCVVSDRVQGNYHTYELVDLNNGTYQYKMDGVNCGSAINLGNSSYRLANNMDYAPMSAWWNIYTGAYLSDFVVTYY